MVLKEQEAGTETVGICRAYGISAAIFYKSKAKYGRIEVSNARCLKALESEHVGLKKLLAEQTFYNAILRDITAKSGCARREAESSGARV